MKQIKFVTWIRIKQERSQLLIKDFWRWGTGRKEMENFVQSLVFVYFFGVFTCAGVYIPTIQKIPLKKVP